MAKKSTSQTRKNKTSGKFILFYNSTSEAKMTLEPPSWRFSSGNSAAIKLFKAKSEKEFISHPPWDYSPKFQADGTPSGEKAKSMIMKAMKTGTNFFRWTHRTLKGKDFFATVLLNKVKVDGKELLQATVTDISKQVEAEEKFRISELKYRKLFENTPDGILIVDAMTGTITDLNSYTHYLLGHPKKGMIGKKVWQIPQFKEITANKKEFVKFQKEGVRHNKNLKFVTKAGEIKHVEFISTVFLAGDKRIIQYNLRDISQRVKLEQELKESCAKLKKQLAKKR